jgi:hypothetical protein
MLRTLLIAPSKASHAMISKGEVAWLDAHFPDAVVRLAPDSVRCSSNASSTFQQARNAAGRPCALDRAQSISSPVHIQLQLCVCALPMRTGFESS